MYYSDFAQIERGDEFSSSPGAKESDFARVHHNSIAGFAHELCRCKYWSVAAIFEIGPYALLRYGGSIECLWGGDKVVAPSKIGDEPSSHQNCENLQVLSCVRDRNRSMSSSERIL